jgi:hypothetical protein
VVGLICVLIFCLLNIETKGSYEGHWSTPMHYVTDFLTGPIPGIRLYWYDGIVLVGLVVSGMNKRARTGLAKPVKLWLRVSMATLGAWALIGISRGANVLDLRLQLHMVMMTLLSAFFFINVVRTPEDFRKVGKAIVIGAVVRVLFMVTFYLAVMRSLPEHMECVTEHGDSTTFAICLVLVLVHAIHERTRKAAVRAVLVSILMLFAIQLNNRRIAWLHLIGGLLIVYFAVPGGSAIRKKIHRYLLIAAPIIGIYVAAGWTNPTGIFKPVASIQSMNDAKNPSTESRNIENLGLIVTLQTSPLIGLGFGHGYTEVSTEYSLGLVSIFPQYRQNPHNSALGLVTFCGALGFTGIWMTFVVCAFMLARTYVFAKTSLEKTVALTSLALVYMHVNQMWGDLGINSLPDLGMLPVAFAAAARLSVSTGAWPGDARAKARAKRPKASPVAA